MSSFIRVRARADAATRPVFPALTLSPIRARENPHTCLKRFATVCLYNVVHAFWPNPVALLQRACPDAGSGPAASARGRSAAGRSGRAQNDAGAEKSQGAEDPAIGADAHHAVIRGGARRALRLLSRAG